MELMVNLCLVEGKLGGVHDIDTVDHVVLRGIALPVKEVALPHHHLHVLPVLLLRDGKGRIHHQEAPRVAQKEHGLAAINEEEAGGSMMMRRRRMQCWGGGGGGGGGAGRGGGCSLQSRP